MATACFLIATCDIANAAEITLDEAVLPARARSVDAVVALNQPDTSYRSSPTYRADLLPEMTFNATIPSYRKSDSN